MYDENTAYLDMSIEDRAFLVGFLRESLKLVKRPTVLYSAYQLKQPFTRKYFYVSEEVFAEAMARAGFNGVQDDRGKMVYAISPASPFFDLLA